jgi:hypothetical protein
VPLCRYRPVASRGGRRVRRPRRCQTAWEAQRRIDEFPLGEHDTPDRLVIPEKLYGRRRESLRKIFSVCRLERLGLLELLQRLRERIDKSGQNARFAEADMKNRLRSRCGHPSQSFSHSQDPKRTNNLT